MFCITIFIKTHINGFYEIPTMTNKIITGERLQQLADIYLGTPDVFNFNPTIRGEYHKQKDIHTIHSPWDNPKTVFCYPNELHTLENRLSFFKNPFVLITHNSDINIVREEEYILRIAEHPIIIHWFAQNLGFLHRKITPLPIGLANSQWAHGDLSFFDKPHTYQKTMRIYMNFQIATNPQKRQPCYDAVSPKVPFLENVSPNENLDRLSKYEFCICPEGNGFDTHRLWEAVSVRTVPVVLNTPFIQTLRESVPIPMVVLDSWESLEPDTLVYSEYEWTESWDMDTYRSMISSTTLTPASEPHMNIVLVCTNNFQEYVVDNIRQLARLGHKHIFMITNLGMFHHFDSVKYLIHLVAAEDLFYFGSRVANYEYNVYVDRDFRNGFWMLTSSRFFYIYEWMKKTGIQNVVHIENDVLLYRNCDELLKKVDPAYIYLPFFSFEQLIVSIMYIPNITIYEKLINHFDSALNDMTNFAKIKAITDIIYHFSKSRNVPNQDQIIQYFPIYVDEDASDYHLAIASSNFGRFKRVFDAASMGQYLGGTDPRNIPGDTRGLINERCIIRCNKYQFSWKKKGVVNCPYITIDDITYPIFNLHIHCKKLTDFM